jgi:hypothetical protein
LLGLSELLHLQCERRTFEQLSPGRNAAPTCGRKG